MSLGARASRPHKTWQGRGDWLHRVGRFTRRLTLEQRLDKYAGGTPALPGGNPWLARCRSLSRALFCRSILPPSHARLRILQKAPQIDQRTDGPASTTSGTKMLLQFCALGVTMSWDDGLLGARASRPHQAWHSLGHLPHLDQPATAPWLSFGLAAAVPADRVAACSIALKLSGGQRDRMRAGRPRSQGNHSPLEGESQKPSRQAKADAVGGWRATSQKADVRPLGNSRLPASRAPAPHDGADHSRVKQRTFMTFRE